MKFDYQNAHQKGGHNCDNLVIICMDFRFQRDLLKLLRENVCQEFDLVGVPGASKGLIDETSRETVLDAIKIGYEKHQIKKVTIIDHIDCGAHGGSVKHLDESKEREYHIDQLEQAAAIISKEFPEIEVKKAYMDWSSLDLL